MSDVDQAVKIAKLETNLDHLAVSVEKLTAKVDELNTLLERSRGALWMLTGFSGLVGFVAAKAAMFIPWSSLAPR